MNGDVSSLEQVRLCLAFLLADACFVLFFLNQTDIVSWFKKGCDSFYFPNKFLYNVSFITISLHLTDQHLK